MEKQEARIKCTSCGSTFKLRVPVTDKPVNFKCKKCGKILKVKLKPAPGDGAAPGPSPDTAGGAIPGLETTQLPDTDDFGGSTGQAAPGGSSGVTFELGGVGVDLGLPSFDAEMETPSRTGRPSGPQAAPRQAKGQAKAQSPEPIIESGYEDLLKPAAGRAAYSPSMGDSPASPGTERRWLVLDDEQVKGPFTDGDVIEMIQNSEITPETALRMGQRPWIKAAQVADFREYFRGRRTPSAGPRLPKISLAVPKDAAPAAPGEAKRPFQIELGSVAPYPLGDGMWQPLAIFAGIAVVLSVVLSLEFLIGLPLSILGWIFLFGYLAVLMEHSKKSPKEPPPSWDFSAAAGMLKSGAEVFAVLLVYSLIPMTICLLVMIAGFLNKIDVLGYVFMLLTILVYLGSLFLAPAGLVILSETESLGTALSPGRILSLVKNGGASYRTLGLVSVVTGSACMIVVLLAVFLVSIPVAGFIVAGLLMGLVLSYANFIWFHVLGMFSKENQKLTKGVLAGARV